MNEQEYENAPSVARYGMGNRELLPAPQGPYLMVSDVQRYLSFCLDDDSDTARRVEHLEKWLRGEP